MRPFRYSSLSFLHLPLLLYLQLVKINLVYCTLVMLHVNTLSLFPVTLKSLWPLSIFICSKTIILRNNRLFVWSGCRNIWRKQFQFINLPFKVSWRAHFCCFDVNWSGVKVLLSPQYPRSAITLSPRKISSQSPPKYAYIWIAPQGNWPLYATISQHLIDIVTS